MVEFSYANVTVDLASDARPSPAYIPFDFEPSSAVQPALSPACSEERTWLAEDGATYKYYDISADEVCVSGCAQAVACMRMPEAIDGKAVVEVAARAFKSCSEVKDFVCASGVRVMGARVFDGCVNLRRLELSAALDYFDKLWVHGCFRLCDLVLPGALETVPLGLFDTGSLRRLVVGAHAKNVTESAFLGSTLQVLEVDPANAWLATDGEALLSCDGACFYGLGVRRENYRVPDGCVRIARKAFAGAEYVREVQVPDTLEEIEPYAFMNTGLECFDAPASLRIIGTRAFLGAKNLQCVRLNEGLEEIGEGAFLRSGITDAIIPSTVRTWGLRAFDSTPLVTNEPSSRFEVSAANETFILDERGGLYRKTEDGLVLDEMVFPKTRDYAIREGTRTIASRAFVCHLALESVVVPEGCEEIGYAAFRGCRKLRRAQLPESLKSIGAEAFFETAVEELYLPAGLHFLGALALVTGGTNHSRKEPALRKVTVHPDCRRFFMESGLLCERCDDGTTQVLLYVGPDSKVVVPREASSFAPYAFADSCKVRELHIHAGLDRSSLCSLAVAHVIDTFVIELKEPIAGQTSIVVRFPNIDRSKNAIMQSFREGPIDPEYVMSCADDVWFWVGDVFERMSWVLERLANPIFLKSVSRAHYQKLASDDVPGTCAVFAKRDYTRGFDLLADLGYLNEGNITTIVDQVGKTGDVAMTGYLLEMKHRRFGGARFDFDI